MSSKVTMPMFRDGLDREAAEKTGGASVTQLSRELTGISNAFTIDVEDYYHVSALASGIPRDTWSQRESRVAASTDRLLAMLDEHRIKGTFFVLGWVADAVPQLVKRIAS